MFRPVSATTDNDKARTDLCHQAPFIREFYKTMLAEALAVDPPRRDLEEIRHAAATALDLLARLCPTRAGAPSAEADGEPAPW